MTMTYIRAPFLRRPWFTLTLVCGAAVLLAVATRRGVSATDTSMQITNPVASNGISIIDPSSSKFWPEVHKFLDPAVESKVAPCLSQGAIIVNNTDRYIWGFTVIYTYPRWFAPSGKPYTVWLNPSAGAPNPPQARMLAPGGSYLVTPVPGVTATRDGAGVVTSALRIAGAQTVGVSSGPSADAVDAAMGRFVAGPIREQVIMVLDSVIFDDGSLVGPDSKRRLFEINDRIRADREFANSLLDLSGEGLKSRLQLHAASARRGGYNERLKDLAETALALMSTQGEPALRDQLGMIRATDWFHGRNELRRQPR